MKNKPPDHGLPYFIMQRIHCKDPDNMLELVKPESEWERSEGVRENIMRWEDDGGPVFETGDPAPPSGGAKHSPADGCGWG